MTYTQADISPRAPLARYMIYRRKGARCLCYIAARSSDAALATARRIWRLDKTASAIFVRMIDTLD